MEFSSCLPPPGLMSFRRNNTTIFDRLSTSERLLTAKEVARMRAISEKTVYSYVARNMCRTIESKQMSVFEPAMYLNGSGCTQARSATPGRWHRGGLQSARTDRIKARAQ